MSSMFLVGVVASRGVINCTVNKNKQLSCVVFSKSALKIHVLNDMNLQVKFVYKCLSHEKFNS